MLVELAKKRKRERRMEKRKNFIIGVLLLITTFVFMDFAFSSWSEEIENHGENNKIWQEKYSE